jgi:hypothetical protein
MKIITRQVKELCLDEEEIKIFQQALYYVRHRLRDHNSKGARSVATL